jgi:hypothetical protein
MTARCATTRSRRRAPRAMPLCTEPALLVQVHTAQAHHLSRGYCSPASPTETQTTTSPMHMPANKAATVAHTHTHTATHHSASVPRLLTLTHGPYDCDGGHPPGHHTPMPPPDVAMRSTCRAACKIKHNPAGACQASRDKAGRRCHPHRASNTRGEQLTPVQANKHQRHVFSR